jgi:polyhydroxybutyrate depolymerase
MIRSRRWVPVLALVGLLAGVAGCQPGRASPGDPGTNGTGAAVPVGASSQTIAVDGRQRTFHVYRPAGLSGPAPLVVMLHGGFGSATQAESSYGWDAEADGQHFVVVYPDGLDRAWAVGGGCCGTPGRTGVDDVAFIAQVVATVSRQLPVDPARVYATGISNGGMMAYRLACESALFAAIGPDSATLLGACPSPVPLSVVHIHGTADHNIPYEGGQGDGPAKINGPAVPAVVDTWRAADRCPAPAVRTEGAVTTSVSDCPDGHAVELITIAGAGHQWPGAAAKSLVQRVLGTDPVSTALNATDTIWAFFATHPRRLRAG